jgi:hypothetical protein
MYPKFTSHDAKKSSSSSQTFNYLEKENNATTITFPIWTITNPIWKIANGNWIITSKAFCYSF